MKFDWMDFEGVRQRLTVAETVAETVAPEVAAVPEPAAVAAPETPVRRGRARLAAVRSAG